MRKTATISRRWSSIAVAILLAFCLFSHAQQLHAQTLRMLAPTGGENLVVDSTYTIRWLVTGVSGTLRVEYSADSGAVWNLIDTTTAVAGIDSLNWVIPNNPTQKAFVRVMTADSTVKAVSRRVSHIVLKPVPILRLISPNGGELLGVDSAFVITWQATNVTGPITVAYSNDSGKTWISIGEGSASNGVDSLTWKVPNDTTKKALVRITSADSSVFATSARVFTIKGHVSPKIIVLTPNGGDVYAGDSTMTIRWTATDVSGMLRIDYSADTGRTWRTISARTAKSGLDSTTWKISSVATTRALIRIMSGTTGTLGDSSDAFFTVGATPPPIPDTLALLYPVGGEKVYADSVVVIHWIEQGMTQKILVSYSVDGGLRWTLIDSVAPHNGNDSLNWKVPSDTTNTAYIRVTTRDLTRISKSAVFSIVVPVTPPLSAVPLQAADAVAGERALSYPNPTNGTAVIRWTQPSAGDVSLSLFGSDGSLIRSIPLGARDAGAQSLTVDLGGLPPGAYHFRMGSASGHADGTLMLVR